MYIDTYEVHSWYCTRTSGSKDRRSCRILWNHFHGNDFVFFVLDKADNRFVVTALYIPETDLRVVGEWTYPNGEKIVLPFNEYARVVVTEEKGKYTDDGVHKGFDGWICDPRRIEKTRLVCFDNVDFSPFPIISVKERDMEVVVPAKEDLIDYKEWNEKGK